MRPSFVLLQWHSCCHGDCWTRPLLLSDVLVRATRLHLLPSSEVSQDPLCDSRSFRRSYSQPRGWRLPGGNARLREKGGAQIWDRHPAGHAWPGLGWLPAHRTSPSRLAAQMDHRCVDGCHRKQRLCRHSCLGEAGAHGDNMLCVPHSGPSVSSGSQNSAEPPWHTVLPLLNPSSLFLRRQHDTTFTLENEPVSPALLPSMSPFTAKTSCFKFAGSKWVNFLPQKMFPQWSC